MNKYINTMLAVSTITFSLVSHAQVATPTISPSLYTKNCTVKSKCTDLSLYMSVQQADHAKAELKDKILFIDVRALEEINYVGTPKNIDGYLPLMTVTEFNEVDNTKNSLKISPNDLFVDTMNRHLESKKLDKNSPVMLICRSGDRTAKAVNLLSKAGYTQVYTVTEGFEGDLSPDGKRSVNGWKNAGMNWEYKLDSTKVIK